MNVPLGPYLNLDSGCYQMLERKLQKTIFITHLGIGVIVPPRGLFLPEPICTSAYTWK